MSALACGRQLLLRADVGGTDVACTVFIPYDVDSKEQVYPVYALPNRSVPPVGPDFVSKPVWLRFWHEGDRQKLSRYAGFQRFSLRQHLPSRFRRSEEHSHGDDSAWGTHRHQRRRTSDADARAMGPGSDP